MVAPVIQAVLERAGVEPGEVEDVIMGAALQQGTQGYNIARQCAIAAGLPVTTAGMSMDRQCSSGMMAIDLQFATRCTLKPSVPRGSPLALSPL